MYERHGIKNIVDAAIILSLFLTACRANGQADTASTPTQPFLGPYAQDNTPLPTVTQSELDKFNLASDRFITDYLRNQGFTLLETQPFLGGTVNFWTIGDTQIDTKAYLKLMEDTYKSMQTIAPEFDLDLPDLNTQVFSGETIHVGIDTRDDSCVVRTSGSQNSLGKQLGPQSDYDACSSNAFSLTPETDPASPIAGNLANSHLVVVTPLPDHPECGVDETGLSPQNTGKKFCLNHDLATKAGFAHELVHAFLRILKGARRGITPLINHSDLDTLTDGEEIFAASVEAGVIENVFGVQPLN